MRIVRSGLKYFAVFFSTLILLTGLLVWTAFIPQSRIRENVKESAEFLCEGELFGSLIEGVDGSKIDRYADSILLGIAYQYDNEAPMDSVMWSSYYYTKNQNENENLLDAVTYGYEPNQQYLRYWHGSNVVLRPLLQFFSIQQIYVLNGIVLVVLVVWLLGLLVKRKAYAPAVGLVVGLILTSSWFVPFSLEYTWTYLLMLCMSIISVKLAFSDRWDGLGICFLIVGMVTNYMDFLTTETITLLIPLLLVIWVDVNQDKSRSVISVSIKAGKAVLIWGIGYVGMWMMKWGIASIVLEENVMPYVTEHITERLGGDVGVGVWQYITGVLGRNLKCLFPLEYGDLGWFGGMLFLALVLYVSYVYHRKSIRKECILLYAVVGLVPYIRYLVLHNHSYLHYFFTYRAQLASIVSIAMILGEVVEWRWLIRADARKGKS